MEEGTVSVQYKCRSTSESLWFVTETDKLKVEYFI